jgi:ADP-ribosylglycohydrolase
MIEKIDGTKLKDKLLGGILGLAVADAVGVPVEFQSRESLRRNPVTDMRGHGTYNQPIGTWSDDTSLTLCLLDSLAKNGFNIRWDIDSNFPQPDYADIMQRFISWVDKGEYTAHGNVFDVGISTQKSLQRFKKGTDPLQCGGTSERDNGNGSLMRILPISFYIYALIMRRCNYISGAKSDRLASCFIHNVSSLTHAHKRSQIACGIYCLIAHFILLDSSNAERSLKQAIKDGLKEAKHLWYEEDNEYAKELKHYKRLFKKDFVKLQDDEIDSTGYVVDTLEAAIWCLLNTGNYKDCVLKAVNLGEDTDTVAAVAGGLAGMFYGIDAIPNEWLAQLARRDYIERLCEKFCRSLS